MPDYTYPKKKTQFFLFLDIYMRAQIQNASSINSADIDSHAWICTFKKGVLDCLSLWMFMYIENIKLVQPSIQVIMLLWEFCNLICWKPCLITLNWKAVLHLLSVDTY